MVGKTTNLEEEIIKLFKSNYLAQYHVREIARLIEKSHPTILPHLKKLENKKVLNSKTIGKNQVYSLNFDNIITKKYLSIAEINETASYLEKTFIIKKITEEIFKLNLSGIIVLFGSYAKRNFNKDSDVDILYIGDEKINNLKLYGKKINIKKTTLKNFELSLRKKDPLINEIIKNHIILQNTEPFINTLWRFYDERR